MSDYVSVGVMPARCDGSWPKMRLCPLCGTVLNYGTPPTWTRSCTRLDCGLIQHDVTGECTLPAENIPRAVARKLKGATINYHELEVAFEKAELEAGRG